MNGLAEQHQNSMQLFALFNGLDVCLAVKKLVSLLCELSCLCVCTTDGTEAGGGGAARAAKTDPEPEQMKQQRRISLGISVFTDYKFCCFIVIEFLKVYHIIFCHLYCAII